MASPSSESGSSIDGDGLVRSVFEDLSQNSTEHLFHQGNETSMKFPTHVQLENMPFQCGAFGQAYIGRRQCSRSTDLVLVKKLKECVPVDAFKAEFDIQNRLAHPNICRLFEAFVEVDDYGRLHMYLVMELCEGGDLQRKIQDTGCFSENTAADVIGQICLALIYAHSIGIAHRDVKPENVCYVRSDASDHRVKIIDWGSACIFTIAPMRSRTGSFHYMAPEVLQADGSSSYTCACDFWSLGIMTYIMLSARLPFWMSKRYPSEDRFARMLNKMESEEYPIAKASWNTISADAKDFIQSLLRVNPSHRLSGDRLREHPWLTSSVVLDGMKNN